MTDKRPKESLHQSVDEALNTLHEENVGKIESDTYDSAADRRFANTERDGKRRKQTRPFSDVRECAEEEKSDAELSDKSPADDIKDSVIDKSFTQTDSDSQVNFWQETQDTERFKKRSTAFLKLSFMAVLLIMVLSVAVVQSSEMPWNVEEHLAEMNSDDTLDMVEEKTEVQPVTKEVTNVPEVEDNTAEKPKTTEKNQPKAVSSGSISWQLPASAQVVKDYGYSYDETWNDYRFHSGLDIEMPKGSDVKTIASGTVTEVGETKAVGEYIRIDYGNNLVGYYYGIDVKDTLKNGSTLKKGDVIGVITEPPLQESSMQPHYHFALIQDGQTVDPMEFLD